MAQIICEICEIKSVVKNKMSDEIQNTNENIPDLPPESGSGEESKFGVIKKILEDVQQKLGNAMQLLGQAGVSGAGERISIEHSAEPANFVPGSARVVEGVFDGQNMIGSDGMQYTIPANYASKSKLVEGDILKLTIAPNGSFIFKQIGPVERNRIVGTLAVDPENGDFAVFAENRKYKVLKASVTYYRGSAGDEVVLLTPKNAPSSWAAVENIIKK